MAVSSSADLRDTRFSTEVEESAYFFVTESLANVIKHAQATRVAVRLEASDGAITVADVTTGGAIVQARIPADVPGS